MYSFQQAFLAVAVAFGSTRAFTGEGTTYGLTDPSGGNCNFMDYPQAAVSNFVAINKVQWDDSMSCGRCAQVTCTDPQCSGRSQESAIVYVVDQCPGCNDGDLDLSPTVFEAITGMTPSKVEISWEFVTCPTSGNIKYCLKEGSNAFWAAIQPTHTIVGVDSVTIDGKPTSMVASSFYFLLDGISTVKSDLSHLKITLTSVSGETIEDVLSFTDGNCVEGTSQFTQGESASVGVSTLSEPTTEASTESPTDAPPTTPTSTPTSAPTETPIIAPTTESSTTNPPTIEVPTTEPPTEAPTSAPTTEPPRTNLFTESVTEPPVTSVPTTDTPTNTPTEAPTRVSTMEPPRTSFPTSVPSGTPTKTATSASKTTPPITHEAATNTFKTVTNPSTEAPAKTEAPTTAATETSSPLTATNAPTSNVDTVPPTTSPSSDNVKSGKLVTNRSSDAGTGPTIVVSVLAVLGCLFIIVISVMYFVIKKKKQLDEQLEQEKHDEGRQSAESDYHTNVAIDEQMPFSFTTATTPQPPNCSSI
ncbi:Lytic transglycosylase [Phytophthora infestans]|uniref:Lytic transglycosylase n=1 Tax=Phytophthora infestans TaxID=4787 RepID=A0A833W431_PHYIN|nr:Lytic transglycosylase [Phytophthora infestans]